MPANMLKQLNFEVDKMTVQTIYFKIFLKADIL